MPNLSQRYIAALAQLSQFQGVTGSKDNLTHVLTGVQVAPHSTDEESDDEGLLDITFAGGHKIQVVAYTYLQLQLSEDAAHVLHSVENGTGEIHKHAKHLWEHLARKHDLG